MEIDEKDVLELHVIHSAAKCSELLPGRSQRLDVKVHKLRRIMLNSIKFLPSLHPISHSGLLEMSLQLLPSLRSRFQVLNEIVIICIHFGVNVCSHLPIQFLPSH